MNCRLLSVACLAIGLCSAQSARGQATVVQSPLGQSLKDIPVAEHWIYDDLPRAIAEAKRTRKPLLIVLRCVPCPPGKALDEAVMMPDSQLEDVEKQFVCVRVIQARGLDLKLFQYDYDMSWNAMFMNPDGTIYGRYGSRNATGPGSDALLSPVAFRKAAERALELHKDYPSNKSELAGKIGPKPDYLRPEQIPGLDARAGSGPTTRQSCIHCHMVREYALRDKWMKGKLSAADLEVYPMPERVGLTMERDDGLRVESVAAGSIAAEAGLAVGDELQTAGGQPLVSMADLQWVLHRSPTESEVAITALRGSTPVEATLKLAGDWKKSDIAWRASSWYGLRQGAKFKPLSNDDKQSRGIAEDNLAMSIDGLFGPNAQKLQQVGLRKGDVIVAIDGRTAAMDESDFLKALRLEHGPRDAVKLTILRGDQRQEFTVPMW